MAGLARARSQGTRIGRRPRHVDVDQVDATEHLSLREAAKVLDVSVSIVRRRRL